MANLSVKSKPWSTPDYITFESPSKEIGSTYIKLHINEVSEDILSTQCNEFRAEIFKKAGKKDPLDTRIRQTEDWRMNYE